MQLRLLIEFWAANSRTSLMPHLGATDWLANSCYSAYHGPVCGSVARSALELNAPLDGNAGELHSTARNTRQLKVGRSTWTTSWSIVSLLKRIPLSSATKFIHKMVDAQKLFKVCISWIYTLWALYSLFG